MSKDSIYIDMKVLYVPPHAHEDLTHTDCERGVVTEIRGDSIFVRFGGDTHSKACGAEQLR